MIGYHHLLRTVCLMAAVGGALAFAGGTESSADPGGGDDGTVGISTCAPGSGDSWCVDGTSAGDAQSHDGKAEQAASTTTSSSGGGQQPSGCGWVTLGSELPLDRNRGLVSGGFANGLPPAGEEVVWQGWCYSGVPGQEAVIGGPYRWVPTAGAEEAVLPSVEDIARLLYEQIQGRMPKPAVVTSPPAGTDAIVTVPVFVTVTNWPDGGALVESHDLLGVAVTVRATSELVLDPGEPGSSPTTCNGPGVGA